MRDQTYWLPQVLAALVPKFGAAAKVKAFPIIPKWKKNLHINVSKHSIFSRTKHVLNSIATAESNSSRWRRVEDLLAHINQYPEARYHAIKEGGVGILLRLRQRTKDEQIQGKKLILKIKNKLRLNLYYSYLENLELSENFHMPGKI